MPSYIHRPAVTTTLLLHLITASSGSAQSILTVAGGQGDDLVSPTATTLKYPRGVAVDRHGNLYIAEQNSHTVRKVTKATGLITTVAGTGVGARGAEDVPATKSSLNYPQAVAVDSDGNIFIADSQNFRVRRVDARTGLIRSLAGGFDFPYSLAVDTAGSVYVTGTGIVKRIEPVSGAAVTVALGKGFITGVAVDGDRNVFFAESDQVPQDNKTVVSRVKRPQRRARSH